MALAALCSQVQQTPYSNLRTLLQSDFDKDASHSPLSRDIKFQAFVVDHGVRKGSDLEAQAVSKVLEERKIPTQLLKIDWTGHEKPGELPNFESLARKYRFQVLGKACRDLRINSLLLAHHEDDQAETVMARLATGHRASGLVGMKPSAEIPECYSLHSVHESGGLDILEWREHKTTAPTLDLPVKPAHIPSLLPLELETGGVRIYRPLLGFSKERLISTCVEERMEWFEDHTNKDPTVTMRNAIRHMHKSHELPAALSKPAILELSRKCRNNQLARREVVNSLLELCSIKFGTRTGTLRVRFANLNNPNLSQLPRSEADRKHIAALLLHRIVMLATPKEHVNRPSLMSAVERVFPECLWMQEPPPLTSFTIAGLLFKYPFPHNLEKDLTPGRKCEWLISRQPFKKGSPQPEIDIPVDSTWSPWILYDGRFWIRVQNLMERSLVIRPFGFNKPLALNDPWPFRHPRDAPDSLMLREVLNGVARHRVTGTLPAIASRDPDGMERVLALPTLGVSIPNVEQLVKWDVRYKKVDTEHIFTLP